MGFLTRSRQEIIELEEQGLDTDKLVLVIDAAADILYNGYRHWAQEIRVVQDRLDAALALNLRLRKEHDLIGVAKEDWAELVKLLQDNVPAAWADAEWGILEKALDTLEASLRVFEYELRRILEQTTGMTDTQLALAYPRAERQKERDVSGNLVVGVLGTTVDPSLEEAWLRGDKWSEQRK